MQQTSPRAPPPHAPPDTAQARQNPRKVVQRARARRRRARAARLGAAEHGDLHAPARPHEHVARVGKDREPRVLARPWREPAEALEHPARADAVHGRDEGVPALVADDLVLHAEGVGGRGGKQGKQERREEARHAGGA